MNAPSRSTAGSPTRPPRWPWAALGVALVWEVLVRIPLVLNAPQHLDSDLAVDGLTLLEATRGHWRWHYPGTPAMGTIPVLLSLPQALVWGATPATLVSGGVVAYGLLTIAVFLLAWRAFGPGVAGWSLVPLACASTGTLWLTSRITGGHILTAAWHAGAFALLYQALVRGGARWSAALGLFCGLGVYLDTMFAITLVGLVPAGVVGWCVSGPTPWRWRRTLACGALAAGAFLVGIAPRELGRRFEPHDAYREQFRPVLVPEVLREHNRLLVYSCLPRLIVGHRLFGLQADPDPRALAGPGPANPRPDEHPAAKGVTALGLILFLASLIALGRAVATAPAAAARAVAGGLLISAAAVAAAFVVSWNIYNSDNYRYLVTLLVPWTIGFGLAMQAQARRGGGGLAIAALCTLVLAGLMSFDAARWYARFGWIDARGLPRCAPLHDPALDWLAAHPEVTAITGGYWDVYRLAFLTGGQVRGTPLAVYPDRFPEWSRSLPGARADVRVLVLRRTPEGGAAHRAARAAGGGRVLFQTRGIAIVSAPSLGQ